MAILVEKGVLVKISDDMFNGSHPNNIQAGHIVEGKVYVYPTVGQRFPLGNFSTSTVTEIMSKEGNKTVFKTKNSTYQLTTNPD